MLCEKAWGKLQKDESGVLTDSLGLLEHSIDVAAVVLRFMQLPTHRRRLENLASRRLDAIDIERLALLAFLHDLGKTCSGFQSKALFDDDRRVVLSAAGIDGRGVDSGHTAIIGALLHNPERCRRLASAVCIAEIDRWGGLDLWLAAVSHHGRPLTFESIKKYPIPQSHQTWKPVSGYDPWNNLEEMGAVARLLFPKAFAEKSEPLPQQPEFVHAFAGLVSLADWIGSDSRAHAFPYDLAEGVDRWPKAVERATQLLRAMCIDVESIREDLRQRSPSFGEVFKDSSDQPFLPTALQSAMDGNDLGALIIAESETGSGKTEAALWRFKHLFERGEVDSLAFLLPTRVSAVQIEERVRSFTNLLFPDEKLRPNVLLALPGYWRVDGIDAKERLPGFEVLWPDGEDDNNVHKRWVAENTKRYLAACCAVGTIDQLLLSGLQTRHAHLRGFATLRSLLVVDEVHASDAYMTRILENILQRHHQSGGHALLLSATLGLSTRDRLLRRSDRDQHQDRPEDAPYPSLTDFTQEIELERSERSKAVHIERQGWLDEPLHIAAKAVEAARQGARVLVIRNTVNAAIETQQAIEVMLGMDHPILFRAGPRRIVCLHHGRYAAADRRILDQEVETQFGKKSPTEGRILVGTQTLEQSLDIDADFMITDLAPIDVLLQRIGRLHRHHNRARPPSFEQAQFVVLTPPSRDLIAYLPPGRSRHGMGPERAYENLPALDATWTLLEQFEKLTIPEQNRQLVESATDPDRLKVLAMALGGDWIQVWSDAVGAYIAGGQASGAVLCKWHSAWDASEFPDDERRIQTRLGIAAVRLELPEKWVSPFGEELQEFAIPHWMVKGADQLDARSQENGSEKLTIETTGGNFVYERFGLSRYC